MATTEPIPISRSLAAYGRAKAIPSADFVQAIRSMMITGLVAVFAYRHVMTKLVLSWRDDPNYSHGFVMPLFALFVVWKIRDRLATTNLRPSWLGLPLGLTAMALLVVGDLGAEYFCSRISFLILIAGLVLLFLGWNHLRALMFAGSMLFLMIPIPTIVLNQITFPLQLRASQLATGMLSVLDVPVFRDGNVIRLPSTTLEVVDACSGIRSLISLIALAAIFGYLKQNRTWHRWLLVLLAIPIAVIANSVRITGTGLLAQYWDSDKAEGFFHLFEGWVIFVLSLGLLLIVDKLISAFLSLRRNRHEG